MSDELLMILEQLQRFNLQIRHDADTADAVVPQINEQIDRLHSSGLITNAVFVGDVILQCPYAIGQGSEDSGQVVFAVLRVPGGLGCCFLDSAEVQLLQRRQGGIEDALFNRTTAFDALDAHVKGKLLPQVRPLVTEVMRTMQLRSL